uniref:Uncharacterized protein n=1 Tax=Erythrolobus madagascarensis TaxID=708628 RepID=A0A7S0T6Y0_9RHOD
MAKTDEDAKAAVEKIKNDAIEEERRRKERAAVAAARKKAQEAGEGDGSDVMVVGNKFGVESDAEDLPTIGELIDSGVEKAKEVAHEAKERLRDKLDELAEENDDDELAGERREKDDDDLKTSGKNVPQIEESIVDATFSDLPSPESTTATSSGEHKQSPTTRKREKRVPNKDSNAGRSGGDDDGGGGGDSGRV